jgi:peptide-methionine (R)-S-oxide reductase
MKKSDQEWMEELGPERYRILRLKGTERPFSGALNSEYRPGHYRCAGCGTTLFESDAKFDSGCGWPSFDRSVPESVVYERDISHGMIRTEIMCHNCGGHLGHVFPDGPTQTGQRYCVNSLSISFDEKSEENPV